MQTAVGLQLHAPEPERERIVGVPHVGLRRGPRPRTRTGLLQTSTLRTDILEGEFPAGWLAVLGDETSTELPIGGFVWDSAHWPGKFVGLCLPESMWKTVPHEHSEWRPSVGLMAKAMLGRSNKPGESNGWAPGRSKTSRVSLSERRCCSLNRLP